MPRRRVPVKRETLPDPKFGDQLLAKFINHVMESGKKSIAESIVYGALDRVQEKNGGDPLEVFNQALENIAADGRGEVTPCGWCHLSGSG